ncbi:hypothetical protein L1887_33084 [Cichorium endivia]|nr:hypothetical protein L1887_33084 [Cichorium endivia]
MLIWQATDAMVLLMLRIRIHAERTKAKYLFYLLMIRIHKETKACCCYSGWMMNTCSSSATFFSNSSHNFTLSFYTPPHFT